jgi:hypothetical protein
MASENDRQIREAVVKADVDAFGQLVEQSPDLLFVIDADGKIPIQYAKDVDAYGALMLALLRTNGHRQASAASADRIAKRRHRHRKGALRRMLLHPTK